MRLEDLINIPELASAPDADISDHTKLLLNYFPKEEILYRSDERAGKARRLERISLGAAIAQLPILYAAWNWRDSLPPAIHILTITMVAAATGRGKYKQKANVYAKINNCVKNTNAQQSERVFIKKPEYLMNFGFLAKEEKIREIADIVTRHSHKGEFALHFKASMDRAREYAKKALGITAVGILPLVYATTIVPQMLIIDLLVAGAGIGACLSYGHLAKTYNIFMNSAMQAAR